MDPDELLVFIFLKDTSGTGLSQDKVPKVAKTYTPNYWGIAELNIHDEK